ncbi:MAG: hypothetical protein KKC01_07290 [Gammaproteobacteria bacterium]|nr:hypothetical protein [Gammaproteobacteria bacterium]
MDQIKENDRSNKWKPLSFILAMSALVGFIESDFFINNIFSRVPWILTNVLLGIGFLWWLELDAKKLGLQYGKVLTFFGLIFPQFTVFYYCYKSRGLKNGSLQALKAIGFIVIAILSLAGSLLLTDKLLMS